MSENTPKDLPADLTEDDTDLDAPAEHGDDEDPTDADDPETGEPDRKEE